MRAPATVVIGAIAVAVVSAASLTIGWHASRATIDAGFWWDEPPFVLSAGDAEKIGGPITADELARIQQISRAEVEHAYEGLRIGVTEKHDAFWRVAVVGGPLTTTRNRITSPFSAAGESRVFGPLGGLGSVAFVMLAHNAIEYAPPAASRQQIVEGIGRGIGRAAVHELAHLALGLDNLTHVDNRTDTNSYEYANADRPSQYYGELQWTTGWPVLEEKFGR
ncbi:MAG TPA: hypothetical protein VKC35_17845 [Vicinamibacterales bacterium]|nr:hypothetical protein [Vicinamibacterales bacterium]